MRKRIVSSAHFWSHDPKLRRDGTGKIRRHSMLFARAMRFPSTSWNAYRTPIRKPCNTRIVSGDYQFITRAFTKRGWRWSNACCERIHKVSTYTTMQPWRPTVSCEDGGIGAPKTRVSSYYGRIWSNRIHYRCLYGTRSNSSSKTCPRQVTRSIPVADPRSWHNRNMSSLCTKCCNKIQSYTREARGPFVAWSTRSAVDTRTNVKIVLYTKIWMMNNNSNIWIPLHISFLVIFSLNPCRTFLICILFYNYFSTTNILYIYCTFRKYQGDANKRETMRMLRRYGIEVVERSN